MFQHLTCYLVSTCTHLDSLSLEDLLNTATCMPLVEIFTRRFTV